MIKTCSTGHNEVCWEHGNHPNGCPVCSQIKRFEDYAPYVVGKQQLNSLQSENRELTCKLRDANIEIEKLKEYREISRNFAQHHMEEYEKMEIKWRQRGEEIEKLKKDLPDTVERSNFAIREDGRNIRVAVERGKRIKALEEKISHLEGELKAAFDHRLSFKSVGPMEKSEMDVMKFEAMKKQRDELLVKVEELEKMGRSYSITKKMLDDLSNWSRGYGPQG